MRRLRYIEIALWGASVFSNAIWAGGFWLPANAAEAKIEKSVRQETLPSRDVWVAAGPAVADGKHRALTTVDLGPGEPSPQERLELSISPVTVAPNESYVVVVSEANGGPTAEPAKELGAFSFFPPPRVGEVRKFYVEVPSIPAEMKAKGQSLSKLSIAVLPLNPDQPLRGSSVRIVGARIVRG
jgi:hypothetical protein